MVTLLVLIGASIQRLAADSVVLGIDQVQGQQTIMPLNAHPGPGCSEVEDEMSEGHHRVFAWLRRVSSGDTSPGKQCL